MARLTAKPKQQLSDFYK